ncbi:MAG: polysaccharide biosynthesis protein, partial [Bacteroidota bacterium]
MLRSKVVLITGGTGSLGKALTKHIFHHHPEVKKLVIFSRDEQKQYEMSHEYSPHEFRQIRY